MKVKDKDFLQFQKWFTYYQKLFGLTGYKVYFTHEPLKDSYAEITPDLPGMCATVRFSNELTDGAKLFKDIRRTALHEVIHLLLARFSDRAKARAVMLWELEEAEEEVVRKLEGLLK